MRSKLDLADAAPESAVRSQVDGLRERISSELQARGVSAPAADVLAGRVADDLKGKSPNDYAGTLDAVALGFRAQSTLTDDLSQNAADLQEIERLMGSFAGELTKLDEVLEVLAAYLRRMRTALPAGASTILH